MDFNDVREQMKLALKCFYKKDWYLIEKNVNERSITHKLAIYMEQVFNDYDVDCEYNRNLDKVKVLNTIADRYNSLELNDDSIELNHAKRRVYPDIIVHRRRSDKRGDNLLVIEVKKFIDQGQENEAENFDIDKLKAYTNMLDELQYCYGMYINLSKQVKKCDIKWFKDGEEKDRETIFFD